jgi:hybrid cluster-associated redox disulfide protein
MDPAFTEDMSMDDIMQAWPATVGVLIRHHMLCVGCPIAPFHTLSDACRKHGIDKKPVKRDIETEVAKAG